MNFKFSNKFIIIKDLFKIGQKNVMQKKNTELPKMVEHFQCSLNL